MLEFALRMERYALSAWDVSGDSSQSLVCFQFKAVESAFRAGAASIEDSCSASTVQSRFDERRLG